MVRHRIRNELSIACVVLENLQGTEAWGPVILGSQARTYPGKVDHSGPAIRNLAISFADVNTTIGGP